MNKITNYISVAFVAVVALMATVSLLGIWEVLVDDVVEKSVLTVGFLVFVNMVIMLGYRFLSPEQKVEETDATWQPLFTNIRTIALRVMIGSAGLLGLVGILGIWEVLDSEIFWRSFSSIAVLAISATVVTAVCLERENHKMIANWFTKEDGQWSFWRIVLGIILFGWVLSWFA